MSPLETHKFLPALIFLLHRLLPIQSMPSRGKSYAIHGVIYFLGIILFWAIYNFFIASVMTGPLALGVAAIVGAIIILFLVMVTKHA